MATNIEVNELKINKMSEAILAEMKNAGTIEPNQIYVTEEEEDSASSNGTTVNVDGTPVTALNFSSDPQTQIDNKVDKVDGKGLSTNDYTNEEKTKLEGLSNYNDSEVRGLIDGKVDKVTGKQLSTNDYTNEDKSKLNGLSNYNDSELRGLINNKVEKVEGKGLSTNDYTTEEKNKLAKLDTIPEFTLNGTTLTIKI